MKCILRSTVTFFLLFKNPSVYGFVGGARGGFSGGGGHGGYYGGGYVSNSIDSNSTSRFLDFVTVVMVFLVFLGLLVCLEWLKKTKIGKVFTKIKQKKYIKKCRHTPIKPKRITTSFEVHKATETLKKKAMQEVLRLEYLSKSSHQDLVKKTLKSFEQLQKAWVARNTTRVARACNNVSYSRKLSKQIETMISLGVYNFIDKTHITECHFIKFYKPLLSPLYILRFVVKGEQIDEYTTQKIVSDVEELKTRPFNCLVDVVPYKNQFKIYQVKIDQHTDDYVLKNQE